MLQQEASRGKGLEIPDARKLLERLDLKGKVITGDAMFCQKSITAKIASRARRRLRLADQRQSENAAGER